MRVQGSGFGVLGLGFRLHGDESMDMPRHFPQKSFLGNLVRGRSQVLRMPRSHFPQKRGNKEDLASGLTWIRQLITGRQGEADARRGQRPRQIALLHQKSRDVPLRGGGGVEGQMWFKFGHVTPTILGGTKPLYSTVRPHALPKALHHPPLKHFACHFVLEFKCFVRRARFQAGRARGRTEFYFTNALILLVRSICVARFVASE